MTKESQDVHCLDPQEEGRYRSEQSFPPSRFSFHAVTRFPRLLYVLFTLCAFLLSVLIIVIAVNNSNLKETQKKQEENISNISLSVQSNFQSLRSDEGSMQERLISLEGVLKKLESDRSLEGSMQERLISLEDVIKKLESDRSLEGSMQERLISLEGVLKKLESDRSLEGSMQERLISLEGILKTLESNRSLEGSMEERLISLEDVIKKRESDRSLEGSMQERLISLEDAIKKLESDRSLETYKQDLEVLRATVELLNRDLQNMSNKDSKSLSCPKDWITFSGSCYLFSKVGRSWEESKKFCASVNAHLVVINTTTEQEFVQQKTIPDFTWIGLTDTDGQWKWVDGTNYETSLKNWIPDQPDDYYGHGLGGGEDCAMLYQNGQWNDDHCSRKYNTVCEQKMS